MQNKYAFSRWARLTSRVARLTPVEISGVNKCRVHTGLAHWGQQMPSLPSARADKAGLEAATVDPYAFSKLTCAPHLGSEEAEHGLFGGRAYERLRNRKVGG